MKATTPRRLGRLLLSAGLAVVTVGIMVAVLTAPNWYVAGARVALKPILEDDTNSWSEPFLFQKELELVQSPAVLSNALARLDFQTPAGRKLAFLRELSPADACAFLRSSLNPVSVRGTPLFEICACHDDPACAALIADAIAEAYCDLPGERRREYNQADIAALETELRRADPRSTWHQTVNASLLAAREGRFIARVEVEMVDRASPPTSQVSLTARFGQWWYRVQNRLPGPPPHPYTRLISVLFGVGIAVGLLGLVLANRRRRQREPQPEPRLTA